MSAPTRKLTPHELRDRMIGGYLTGYQRAQIQMTPAEVEKQVIADCQLVDAARAAGDINGRAPTKPAEPVKPRANEVLSAQLETGTRLGVGDAGQYQRFQVLHRNPQKRSERWGAAVARIARILEGIDRTKSNLVVAVENAEMAELAIEYADLWAHFKTKDSRPPLTGKDRNPFRGLSNRDAARMFEAKVYDICDRSTGKLGSWYVK